MGIQNLSEMIVNTLFGFNESFESKEARTSGKDLLKGIAILIVSMFIILLSGILVKFLWNNSMPFMFTTARPVSSLWTVYAFMLMVYFVL